MVKGLLARSRGRKGLETTTESWKKLMTSDSLARRLYFMQFSRSFGKLARRNGKPIFLSVGLASLLLGGASRFAHPAAAETAESTTPAEAIQLIAEDFRNQLEIQQGVRIVIGVENQRMASVRRSLEDPEVFEVSIDRSFLEILDEEELRAAVAHEMGHVWIFTNHPYLHTEALANRLALRLVSRESLDRVYQKVWLHQEEKGDSRRFFAE